MIVRVHTSNLPKGNNKGSSEKLFDYLSKEDQVKDHFDKTGFFNYEGEGYRTSDAIRTIDGYKGKLGKSESKFFMLTINPSERELRHIMPIGSTDIKSLQGQQLESYERALQEYTKRVMDNYANSFDRGVDGKDLVFFAKIEHERQYKGDEAKKLGVERGTNKPGLQSHIHVVVHRYNKDQTMKLSPLGKKKATGKNTVLRGESVKSGFNHMDFRERNEESFDKMFGYARKQEETINFHVERRQRSFSSANLDRANDLMLNSQFSPLSTPVNELRKQDIDYIVTKELKAMNPIAYALKEQYKELKKGLMYGYD
nr:DUF5712 family protein [uncultured Allomuricauda sp.]